MFAIGGGFRPFCRITGRCRHGLCFTFAGRFRPGMGGCGALGFLIGKNGHADKADKETDRILRKRINGVFLIKGFSFLLSPHTPLLSILF